MSDNKPCPWCKHDDFVESNNYPFVQIECTNCGSMGPISRNRSDAMEKWNESMLMQEISMLQAALEAVEYDVHGICLWCAGDEESAIGHYSNGLPTCSMLTCRELICGLPTCGLPTCGMLTCGLPTCGLPTCGGQTCMGRAARILSYFAPASIMPSLRVATDASVVSAIHTRSG